LRPPSSVHRLPPPVPSLLSPVSYLLSPVSCLLSPAPLTPHSPARSNPSHRPHHHLLPQQRQPLDHLFNVSHGGANPAQCILPKGRVVEMNRQVLQHQRQCRSRVLEVVNKKGGHHL